MDTMTRQGERPVRIIHRVQITAMNRRTYVVQVPGEVLVLVLVHPPAFDLLHTQQELVRLRPIVVVHYRVVVAVL